MHDQLTLFCCPKPLRGHIATIQRNAIYSWLRLDPRPHLMLFGQDEGISDLAREVGVPHVASVACTPHGTPRLDSVFAIAQEQARTPWLGYVNADILLLDDFSNAFRLFLREMDRRRQTRALLMSQRVDVVLHDLIDFADPAWQANLRQLVERAGARMPKVAIDLFLFNRGLYQDLLPLALGRVAFDNYLVWKARARRAAIVDASDAFLLVHQCHDYAHAGGLESMWKGEESAENERLTRGRMLSMTDATHTLDKRGLRKGAPAHNFDLGALAIQRIRAGLTELDRGNIRGAQDLLENLVVYIQGLQHYRDRLERVRPINRVKRLVAKASNLLGFR